MKLNKTLQHLDDKCYKKYHSDDLLSFVQNMKYRMQLTQERREYVLTTNSMKFMQQISSSLSSDSSVCN